jgi:hypothetical protein
MEIDLGQEITYDVKYNGEIYKLREPSVSDVNKFQQKMKKSDDDDNINLTLSFITELGLPDGIAKNLGVQKMKLLVEKIVGELQEKK